VVWIVKLDYGGVGISYRSCLPTFLPQKKIHSMHLFTRKSIGIGDERRGATGGHFPQNSGKIFFG